MHVLRGRKAILEKKSILDELSNRADQPGASKDLDYHLLTPDARKKNPCLVLVPAESGISDAGQSVQGFVGAVLVFEYKVFGLGSRLFASADTTGRRTVIGPAAARARIAAYACRYLLQQGAHVVTASIYEPGENASTHSAVTQELGRDAAPRQRPAALWSMVGRRSPLYLPLASSFDETLACIGKKTRTNLRYYRRRAEKDLGCTFTPDVRLGLDDFLAFNRMCRFAVADELARWRFEALQLIEQPFLHGVRDRNGRWLSLACGRHLGDVAELEWQCNRADLPASSLSTVMRSYLIEHEGAQGIKRLYFEGGTPSSLQQSFVREGAADLTVCRQSAYVELVRRFAGRLFPPKNQMAQILMDPDLTWTTC